MNTGTFTFTWADREDGGAKQLAEGKISNPPRALRTPLTSRESEIFLPSRLTHGRRLVVQGLSEDDKWRYDERRQTLFIVTGTTENALTHEHRVVVSVDPPLRPTFFVNDFWSDFGERLSAVCVAASAAFAFWIYWTWMG